MLTIALESATASPESIGNKAASLVELQAAGFRVPRAICATVEAYRRWGHGGMTHELRQALLAAFHGLSKPLAVRSSSPVEDLPEASFAGQYVTVLGVTTEAQFLAAVERCWASADSEAAVAYARARDTQGTIEMAVLVQEIVDADAAGVTFTVNPVTGRIDQIVLNANYGLGDSVVSGHAEPDTLVIDKNMLEVIEQRIGSKRVATRLCAGSTAELPVEESARAVGCLSDAQIRILAESAIALEEYFDLPIDAEWAFRGDELYMLQARPVTTEIGGYLSDRLDDWARHRRLEVDHDQIWVRGSVLSGLRLSPLYYSEMSAFFADMFVRVADLHRAPAIRRKIFKYHNGFAYTDAEFSSTADPPGNIRPESPFGPAWRANLAIALRHPLSLAFWSNIDYYNERWRRHWWPEIETRRPDFESATPAEIRDYIEFLEGQRRDRSVVAGLAVGYAPNFVGLLAYLIERWSLGPVEDLLGALTSGLPDSLTHDENVALSDLAEVAERSREVREAVLAGRFADLEQLPGGGAFIDEVDRFRTLRAHRGCSDRDIFQPRWGDDRALLLRQVQLMLRLGRDADPRVAHARTAARREQEERAVLARLDGPFGGIRRAVFKRVLRATQRYVMHRDNQRHTFEPYFMELRGAYFALGENLVRRGILADRSDVFFLAKTEIYQHLDGALSDAKLAHRADARRRWWGDVSRCEPPAQLRGNRPYDPDGAVTEADAELQGAPGAPGVARGPVRVIGSLAELERIQPGDIVVTYAIDPAWTPVFGIIAGVISVEGGMLAHAAVLGREYGLPVVLGVKNATSRLRDGDLVQIDGSSGAIGLLNETRQPNASDISDTAAIDD
jgi:pyruvate,water dikinase